MSPRRDGPRPITPRSLGDLAWRTLADDRASYVRGGRPRLRDVALTPFPPLRRPVFIIGAPRSGTTFLGRCVAALPEVSYHFEPVATKAAARYVHDGLWSERRARLFYRCVYRWLLRIHLDGGRRLAEKTPRNCFLVGFLARAFPGARFLLIVRDGRDAALSLLDKPWLRRDGAETGRREPGGYPYGPWAWFWVEPERRAEFEATTDLHRCAWAWRRYNEAALDGLAALPGSASLELRYEDLVRDPAAGSRRVLDFLEIDRRASRSAFAGVAAGASADSVGRWRGGLSAADRAVVEGEAGALLGRLGYGAGSGREAG